MHRKKHIYILYKGINRYIVGCKCRVMFKGIVKKIRINRYIVGCKWLYERWTSLHAYVN